MEEVLGIGNGLRMERPRSPCEGRENPRQIKRAQGEVRKPKARELRGRRINQGFSYRLWF